MYGWLKLSELNRNEAHHSSSRASNTVFTLFRDIDTIFPRDSARDYVSWSESDNTEAVSDLHQ